MISAKDIEKQKELNDIDFELWWEKRIDAKLKEMIWWDKVYFVLHTYEDSKAIDNLQVKYQANGWKVVRDTFTYDVTFTLPR